MTVELHLLEAFERADAVVAARKRLDQQAPQRWLRGAHARAEQRGQRPRAGHERRHAVVAVGPRRVGCERRDVGLHLGVNGLAGGRDDRLVEVAEADLAGEVGQHRVATLQRGHQPVERLAEVVADVSGELLGLLEAPVEDRHDRRARRLGPLLRDEEAVARLLERRRAVQALDPVVRERAPELLDERGRQPLRVGVEGAQPRVQVLLRAGQQRRLGIGLVVAPT